MKWAELTSKQLDGLSRDAICVLPLGATEQHGPHLPLATDQIIADGIAARLDAACDGRLLVLPGLPATCSAHHMSFPGSLSLDHEAFSQVVLQLVRSAAHHAFTRFFLLNAHGGNIAIGGVIAEKLSAQLPHVELLFGTWFRMAGERLRHLVEGEYPAVGHACEFETSLVMTLRPELVDRQSIADDGIPPSSPLLKFDLLSGGQPTRSLPFDRLTSNGVWGKPSKATASKGEAILNITIPLMIEVLRAHWPQAPGLEQARADDADVPLGSSDVNTPAAGRAKV